MNNRFTFLGTGGSMGVPVLGCSCNVCKSNNPHNKRFRTAAMVEINGKILLFDCGPDFRMQALRQDISHIDGIIFTHSHYDHTGGFDELRSLNARRPTPIPCLLSEATLNDLKDRFPYVFNGKHGGSLTTKIDVQILDGLRGSTKFLDIPLSYMTYEQSGMLVNGFRLGNLAYISDIKKYPESIFDDLKGVETLIVSCLRIEPSPFHLNVEEAIAFSEKVGAKKAYFTHIAHELDHDKVNAELPANMQLAYDGLQLLF